MGDVLRRLDLRGVRDLASALPTVDEPGAAPSAAVAEILAAVRDEGDAAVRRYTARFDGIEIESPAVAAADLTAAVGRLAPELAEALTAARNAVLDFHRAEAGRPHTYRRDGITVESRPQPVDRAGVYVPGGLAAYPSTVLMTVLPARAAGVADVVVCAPPAPDGSLPDAVLAAADLCGVDEVYRIGGAQAIGALAYGTETIRPVDVIAGPGNVYVATAKQQVAGHVGLAAAFAGPSEIVVVADSSTPVTSAAIDVVVQAEHGPGGRAWLITWESDVADRVDAEIARIVDSSPRREQTMSTLSEGGYLALVDDAAQAVAVANVIAPEHLQLMNADPASILGDVRHAGAVFVGPWSPASIGDYIAGPSHVLPTAGTARFAGALTVEDFQKRMHVISVDRTGFEAVRPHVATLARAEGLVAHAESVERRAEWVEKGTVAS